METRPPVVVTGQQIGVGWTPALSVVKALTALAVARSLGGQALYWMADEDHDQAEVASTVALEGDRLRRHRFQFHAAPGTATGWLPWTADHQREAEHLWGDLPAPEGPTLRDHVLCLGEPLARRGLGFFSPTLWEERASLQAELEHWRSLDLETPLLAQAQRLRLEGAPLPLDPATQSAWFSLHPGNGRRRPLAPGEPCPSGHWLSPGAALRPLMQTRMLTPSHVVLGPAERAYWRLAEPLWERVGLEPPAIVPRPSVMVVPKGFQSSWLEPLRQGDWAALAPDLPPLPSRVLGGEVHEGWSAPLQARFDQELARARHRLARLDHRLRRDEAQRRLGQEPERLRQSLFPFDKPQERVLPGLFWLRRKALLDRMLERLDGSESMVLIED